MAITTPVQAFKQSPPVRERTNQVLQQAVQQRPDLSPELLKDNAKISDEFMDEVGKIGETQGYDPSMLSALAGNFLDQKANQDPEKDSAKQAEKVGGDKKGPKKTMEAKWDPTTRSGEVIPPQGKIGEVTTRTTTEPNEEAQKKDKKAALSSKVQAPQGAAASQKNGQNPPKNQDQAKNDDKDEKVEFSQETREMLNKMQAQGMKTPGLDPSQSGPGNEAKAVSAAQGGGGQRSVSEKTDEVFMPSQGVTQAVKVRDRGEIKNGDVIMTYRKLDDLPSGSIAILKAKTGKEGVDEYNKRIQEGEKIPELTKEQQRQLMNPIAEK